MPFSIEVTHQHGSAVVSVRGRVDMYTSPDMRDALLPLFNPETKGLVVDLSQVSFMDSSGIATLVEGLSWSRKSGRSFILSGIGETVINALSLNKLSEAFSIVSDVHTALKQISSPFEG